MEETFRYLAIRDPLPVKAHQPWKIKKPGKYTVFSSAIVDAIKAGADVKAVSALAVDFQAGNPDIVNDPTAGALGEQLADALDHLLESDDPLSADDFKQAIEDATGKQPADLVGGAAFDELEERLHDASLSRFYAPNNAAKPKRDPVRHQKLNHFIGLVAKDEWPDNKPRSFEELLNRANVLMAAEHRIEKPKYRAPNEEEPPADPTPEVKQKISRLKSAKRDLNRVRRRKGLEAVPQSKTPIKYKVRADLKAAIDDNQSTLGKFFAGTKKQFGTILEFPPEDIVTRSAMARLPVDAFGLLADDTKKILIDDFGIDPEKLDPIGVAMLLDDEIRDHTERLPKAKTSFIARLGNLFVKVSPGLRAMFPSLVPTTEQLLDEHCVHYAGVGDLQIVRQKLIGYELADIAHVENVLIGEFKSREHRRLDKTETVTVDTTETDTETITELSSTERHELETESQKQAEQEVYVDGSLTVSGSYGPTISFTANVSGGFSMSSSSSNSRSSKFAQEVTQKAISRIKERVVKQRTRVTLREIEETNEHGIENKTPNHIRGVYRWLNKLYEAQVYSYGLRHMFEFIVPEPAAFYLFALQRNNALELERMLDKPDFEPSEIDRASWSEKVSFYNAQGVSAPPPEFQWVAFNHNIKEDKTAYSSHSAQIAVPQGYRAVGALVNFVNSSTRAGNDSARVGIHNIQLWAGMSAKNGNFIANYEWVKWVDFGPSDNAEVWQNAPGTISVTYRDWNFHSMALGIDTLCELSTEHFEQWQYETYAAIMEAYGDYEADYKARIAASTIQEGVGIDGANPLQTQEMINAELRRACLSILLEDSLTGNDAFKPISEGNKTTTDGQLAEGEVSWEMDFAKVANQAPSIRFFEQAFEWENMTYVFYPSFWGRFSNWIRVVASAGDPDPNLSAFVKAGAARVQIPCRPGFEAAIAKFCQTGVIPEEADSPVIGDDLYVPIIEEIKARLDSPGKEKEVGKPWPVTVPTSLVVLEDAGNLSGFRDPLFGDEDGLSQIEYSDPVFPVAAPDDDN